MEKAVYIIFLLCGILPQGLYSLSEENEKSSDVHIRQKRIAGGRRRHHEEARYLVHLLDHGSYHCPATLLTNNIAITSAQCYNTGRTARFTIQSAATSAAKIHLVERMVLLAPNYNSSHPTVNNLALLKFSPAIDFSASTNMPISIFSGTVSIQDLHYQVFTWARALRDGERRVPATYLRSISVLLLSIDYCRQMYPGIIGVGNLCTYASKVGEHCDPSDTGAPLVVEGQLLGIMVFHGNVRSPNPDVFMNLLDHDIRRWIHGHIPSLRLF